MGLCVVATDQHSAVEPFKQLCHTQKAQKEARIFSTFIPHPLPDYKCFITRNLGKNS